MLKKILYALSLTALFLIPLFALFPMPSVKLNTVINVIYSLFFYPFETTNYLFFPFITGKAFYFRALVEIAFASWIILAFLDAKYRPRINALTIGATVFMLVVLVADLLGVNPIRSIWSNFERMEGWITIFHLWMFFLVSSSVLGSPNSGSRLWHRWFNFSLCIAVIVAGYGFAQLFGWADIHQGSTRLDASLGNAIYMAVYMLFHAFIAAYFFFEERARGVSASIILQWAYGLFTLVAAFMIFETATRGTILGLIGGILLASAVYAVFGRNEPSKLRWRAVWVIAIIVAIGIVFWMNRDAQFVQRNEVLRRMASISWSETTTQARAYTWPMALTGWTQRPILGWGQENFNYVFNYNYNPLMWHHEQWFDRAHNIYLDWLINGGIVGLLSYLSLYVFGLYLIWKSSISFTKKSVLTGLIAAYAVHNIFVFDNLASYVAFFALLSYIGSGIYIESNEKKNKRKTLLLGGEKIFSAEVIEYAVAPVAIIALVIGFYFVNVRAVVANTRLIAALQTCVSPKPDVKRFEEVFSAGVFLGRQETREQLLSCTSSLMNNQQITPQIKQAFLTETGKGIEGQIAEAPKDARMYVLGGQFLNGVGQIPAAVPLLEKAHLLSPHKQMVTLSLADSYLNTGKENEGIALLKEAYELDPSYPQAKTAYAYGLVIAGREAEARKLFDSDPGIFDNEQAASLYTAIKSYDKAITIYKKIIVANPKDANYRLRLAQVYYLSGDKYNAIKVLEDIAKDFPEYKTQVDTAIKSLQK